MEVYGLGFPLDDGTVGDTNGSGVASLDGNAWLGPTLFNEGLLERDHFFGFGAKSS
jgi:hypothetical protein